MPETLTTEEIMLPEKRVQDLTVARDPCLVLEEARKAAQALKQVIDGKPKKVMFNGEVYLEFEDWATVARFYGITVRIRSTKFIEYGEVKGFEATADALLVAKDQVISSAEAMCLNDEENWSSRPRYEWHYALKSGAIAKEAPTADMIWEDNPDKPGKKRPKKVRVQLDNQPVPLFQLRSMAQTRACAKALRNVLAWVVVLAGYKPTPAEEMAQVTAEVVETVASEPSATSTEEKLRDLKTTEDARKESSYSTQRNVVETVTVPESKRIYAIARSSGWTDAQFKISLLGHFGYRHTKEVSKSKYKEVCEYFEHPPDEGPPKTFGATSETPF